MGCEYPIVEHRVASTDPAGWGKPARKMSIFECPDPECTVDADEHEDVLPCRWSWTYAHGKAFNGSSFPRRRCPGCDHISRAGTPEEGIAATR